MEKYAAKCKNQNFMSKLSLKSLFGFLKLGFTSGLSTIFCIWKFSKIEKTWVEGTITFRVIKKKKKKRKVNGKKKHMLNIGNMKNLLCLNFSVINLYQIYRADFWFS